MQETLVQFQVGRSAEKWKVGTHSQNPAWPKSQTQGLERLSHLLASPERSEGDLWRPPERLNQGRGSVSIDTALFPSICFSPCKHTRKPSEECADHIKPIPEFGNLVSWRRG